LISREEQVYNLPHQHFASMDMASDDLLGCAPSLLKTGYLCFPKFMC
jgi:hypothetical protein